MKRINKLKNSLNLGMIGKRIASILVILLVIGISVSCGSKQNENSSETNQNGVKNEVSSNDKDENEKLEELVSIKKQILALDKEFDTQYTEGNIDKDLEYYKNKLKELEEKNEKEDENAKLEELISIKKQIKALDKDFDTEYTEGSVDKDLEYYKNKLEEIQ